MKLKKENKFYLILGLLFCMYSCTYKSSKDIITGKWWYKSITRNDTIIPITETDFFELNQDSTFQYQVSFLNKDMQGNWELKSDTLILNYQNPNTTRKFYVEYLSEFQFKLNEGNMQFEFTKD